MEIGNVRRFKATSKNTWWAIKKSIVFTVFVNILNHKHKWVVWTFDGDSWHSTDHSSFGEDFYIELERHWERIDFEEVQKHMGPER